MSDWLTVWQVTEANLCSTIECYSHRGAQHWISTFPDHDNRVWSLLCTVLSSALTAVPDSPALSPPLTYNGVLTPSALWQSLRWINSFSHKNAPFPHNRFSTHFFSMKMAEFWKMVIVSCIIDFDDIQLWLRQFWISISAKLWKSSWFS